MRRPLRVVAGLTALVAPIAVGWAYTAGASVGDGGFGVVGLFTDDETIDEFLDEDGYLITRESYGGVVTMTVVDPDGVELAIDELPAEIAARVAYYESDWSPPTAPFQVEDGVTCYTIDGDARPGYGVVEDIDGLVRAIQVEAGDDGAVTIEAREWAPGTLTAEQQRALQVDDIPIADTPGGTEIGACD